MFSTIECSRLFTFINPIWNSVENVFGSSVVCQSCIAHQRIGRYAKIDVVVQHVDKIVVLHVPRCVTDQRLVDIGIRSQRINDILLQIDDRVTS